MRRRRLPLVSCALALAASLVGCRLHIDHVKDGTPLTDEQLAKLEIGKTTLDQVLGIAGAPDHLEWAATEDTLVYDDSTIRATRWVLENPYTYVGGVGPTTGLGEVAAYVMFTASRTGRPLPSRPPAGNRPGTPPFPGPNGGYDKPLKLNGDAVGVCEFRFTFDRESQTLVRVEVSRNAPAGGVSGIAAGTFLR